MSAGTNNDQIIIRASSTPDGLDCPRRWAARHMRKLLASAGFTLRELPTHIGAPIGTGVHAAAAFLLKGKRDQGQVPLFEDAVGIGVTALEGSMEEASEVMWDPTAGSRGDAQRQVIRMSETYLTNVVPIVEPQLVEENLYATYPGEPGFLIKGQLDQLLTWNDLTGQLDDLKTGSTPNGIAAQIGTYSDLVEAHGYTVNGLATDYIKRTALAKAQPLPVRVLVDKEAAVEASREAITYLISATKRFQVSGNPASFRANPSSRLCGEKWCPAWGTGWCRAHLLRDL
jgi:hypothetical protein